MRQPDGKYKLGQREFVIVDGRLVAGNAWQDVYRLEKAGFFTCVGYGPATYGHVDFFPTRKFYELSKLIKIYDQNL